VLWLIAWPRAVFGAALDFSQAFDRLHPEISIRVLIKAGFPQQLTNTLRQVWTHQHRVMTFDGESLEQPLETGQATPQGDPFGPLLMAVWMVAATNEIESGKKNEAVTLQKVYVDDRNFTATTAKALLDRKQQWEQWSAKYGMKENAGKAQVTGATRRKMEELRTELQRRGLPEDLLVGPLEVLGEATRGDGTVAHYTERERDRLEQATCVAATVAALPVARETKRRYQKVLAMSKANYGWAAKAPTKPMRAKLNAAVRRLRHNHTSKHLCNLVDVDLDVETTTAVKTVSVLCRRLARGTVTWDSARKTPTRRT